MPIGFNFRLGQFFVTDVSPDVTIGISVPNYSATPGYGWTDRTAVGRDVANRDSGVDARLAGILVMPNSSAPANLEFRVDCGSGTFNFTAALGDAGDNNGPHRLEVFDGANATAILSITTPAATTTGQFYDATNVLRASAAAWVSNNVPASITVTSEFVRVRFGGAATGITCIPHMSLVQTAGGGPALPVILHHLRQQGIVA